MSWLTLPDLSILKGELKELLFGTLNLYIYENYTFNKFVNNEMSR